MSSQRTVVREIAWLEIFPWLLLVRAVGIAMRVRLLVLASLAVLLTIGGWGLLAWAFSGADHEPPLMDAEIFYESSPWQKYLLPPHPDPLRGLRPLALKEEVFSPPQMGRFPDSPLHAGWWELSAPFRQLFDWQITFTGLAFLLLAGIWVTAVWAFFGSAITRMAAMQVAREQQIGWRAAIGHASSKWTACFTAPWLPLIGVLLVTIPTALIGLLLRLDVGALLVAIIWPVLLVGGLLMAIFLLGLFFGWPLLWAAVSTESSDSFDALSRAYSYVYQRPYHYLFYAAVATFLGVLGGLLVHYFASAVLHLALWALSWGCGNARLTDVLFVDPNVSSVRNAAAWLFWFWSGFVPLVALGFVYSYFWTAVTTMYLLLRYHVDGTEIDEIYVDEPTEPQPLPTLVTDPAGVSVVPTEETAP